MSTGDTAQFLYTHTKAWVRVLIGSIILLVILYGWLVNTTVAHVVARKSAEREVATLRAEVGALEANFLTTNDEVSPTLALTLGFSEGDTVHYVSNTRERLTYHGNGAL